MNENPKPIHPAIDSIVTFRDKNGVCRQGVVIGYRPDHQTAAVLVYSKTKPAAYGYEPAAMNQVVLSWREILWINPG